MDKDGRIIKGVGGAYTVLTNGTGDSDEGTYICNARGVFRNRQTVPLIGDDVTISVKTGTTGVIHTIKPRKNELRRPPVANLDQVIITMAAAQPAFNPGLLDAFLLLAEHTGIPAIICINKYDLYINAGACPYTIYANAGYPLIYTSISTGLGLNELRNTMASESGSIGKISVFAGPSGVGKSSLLNYFIPSAKQVTGDLSIKSGRGKHTTRHCEIIPLGTDAKNGFLVDTPGFSKLDVSDIARAEIAPLFREFRPFLGQCRFSNCMHDLEVGCAIKAQVGAAIHPARYESYVRLINLT